MKYRTGYYFVLKCIFFVCAVSLPSLTYGQLRFHVDTVFFKNEEVHKVSVGIDKNVWCIKGSNRREIGRVGTDLTAVDLTGLVTSATDSAFVSIAGLDSNRAFIGLKNDYLLRLNADGSVLHVGTALGLKGSAVNNMLKSEIAYDFGQPGQKFSEKAVLVGTESGLYATENYFSFTKVFGDQYTIVPEETYRSNIYLDGNNYIFFSMFSTPGSPPVIGANGFFYATGSYNFGIFYDSSSYKAGLQPVVNSAEIYVYSPSSLLSDDDVYWYWGTDNGLFKRWRGNAYANPGKNLDHLLRNQKVNKVKIVPKSRFELHGDVITKNRYVIVASDSGFYSGRANGLGQGNYPMDTITKVDLGTAFKAFDLAVDTISCGVLWLATSKGLYKISTSFSRELVYNAIFPADTVNICDTLVKLTAAALSGGIQVQWQKDGVNLANETDKLLTTSVPGLYRFRVQNDFTNSCFSRPVALERDTGFAFTYPNPNPAGVCVNDSVKLKIYGSDSYRYLWYRNGQATAYIDSVFFAHTNGSYKVRVTNCYDRSVFSDSVRVFYSRLTKPGIHISRPFICGSDPVVLSATATGVNISWLPPSGIADNTNLARYVASAPGYYSMTLTDSIGCHVRSDTLNLIQKSPPGVSLRPAGPVVNICRGSSLSLSGVTNGLHYGWLPGENAANTMVVQSAGTYTFRTYTDSACVATDSITVTVSEPPVVHLGNDTVFCEGELVPIRMGVAAGYKQYVWNIASSGNVNVIEVYKAGAVVVSVTDDKNCTASDTAVLTDRCSMVIPNVFTPNHDGVNDNFYIDKLRPNCGLTVYNRWGADVFSNENYDNRWNGNDLADGLYYYSLFDSYYGQYHKGWVQIIR